MQVKSFITYKMRYSLEPHYKKIFDKSLDVGKSMKKKYGKKY